MTQADLLINRVLKSKDEDLEDALYDLVDYVKLFELEDDKLGLIKNTIPDIIPNLTYKGPFNIIGCTLSIIRRIALNEEATIRLVELLHKQPTEAVIEGVAHIEPENWSDNIEIRLLELLQNSEFEHKVIWTLYQQQFVIQNENTLIGLKNYILQNPRKTEKDTATAIMSYSCRSGSLKSVALIQLKELLELLPLEQKKSLKQRIQTLLDKEMVKKIIRN
ncbi:hypothetical protein KH5_18700 [Urechidicola sp. KH5]